MATEMTMKTETRMEQYIRARVMTEAFVRDHSGEYNQPKLVEAMFSERWINFPKYCAIKALNSMRRKGAIASDGAGHIKYIHNPALCEEYHGRDDLRIG